MPIPPPTRSRREGLFRHGKAFAQRSKNPQSLPLPQLCHQACPFAHHSVKHQEEIVLDCADGERPSQKRVKPRLDPYHHELPGLGCPRDLSGAQSHEPGVMGDRLVGYDFVQEFKHSAKILHCGR